MEINKNNLKLIEEHLERCAALPSQPGESRLRTIETRLRTVARLISKPLDSLEEKDLQNLNLAMRNKGMESAADYRKVLKRFLKLKDKKKYIDLIDSDYLKAPRRNGHKKLVDPDNFWTEKENNRYIEESKAHSNKQAAWAGLWIATGSRPHELLALQKQNIQYDNENKTLLVKIPEYTRQGTRTKTGKRSIVLNGNEGAGVWQLAKPHLETLKDNNWVFDCSYQAMKKVHTKICKRCHITKPTNFYNARKARLTRFYNENGLSAATSMAGHTPGSSAMKHYVAMSEQQLKQQTLPKVELKPCPNPSCGQVNEPHQNLCQKCGSPLDRKKFAAIFEKTTEELIDAKLALFKKDFEIKLLKKERG